LADGEDVAEEALEEAALALEGDGKLGWRGNDFGEDVNTVTPLGKRGSRLSRKLGKTTGKDAGGVGNKVITAPILINYYNNKSMFLLI